MKTNVACFRFIQRCQGGKWTRNLRFQNENMADLSCYPCMRVPDFLFLIGTC